MEDLELKLNLTNIITMLIGGIVIWFLKDLVSSLRKNTHEIIALSAKFEIFEKRTDKIPDMVDNLINAHKRITDLENKIKKEISQ